MFVNIIINLSRDKVGHLWISIKYPSQFWYWFYYFKSYTTYIHAGPLEVDIKSAVVERMLVRALFAAYSQSGVVWVVEIPGINYTQR